jgi:hypothetical protein
MTVPTPPVAGPVPLGDRLDPSLQGGVAGDIQASLPDLDAMSAEAQSNAHAWQEQIRPLMDSPAGYGADGLTVDGGNAAGADGDWPTDMSFGHQGP